MMEIPLLERLTSAPCTVRNYNKDGELIPQLVRSSFLMEELPDVPGMVWGFTGIKNERGIRLSLFEEGSCHRSDFYPVRNLTTVWHEHCQCYFGWSCYLDPWEGWTLQMGDAYQIIWYPALMLDGCPDRFQIKGEVDWERFENLYFNHLQDAVNLVYQMVEMDGNEQN